MSAQEIISELAKLSRSELERVDVRLHQLLGGNGDEQVGRRIESFLDGARRLESRGAVDAALDLIYDQVDEMLKAGKFDQVNQLLSTVEANSLSLDLLLGLLTVTLPARCRLPARSRLFREAETVLKLRGEWEEGLLTGLEN